MDFYHFPMVFLYRGARTHEVPNRSRGVRPRGHQGHQAGGDHWIIPWMIDLGTLW